MRQSTRLILGSFLIASLSACGSSSSDNATSTNDTGTAEANAAVTTLGIEDQVVGTGTEAVAGKTVSVHYIGTFLTGKKFDSSYDRGSPFNFTVGKGQVIQGWDLGIPGMKVGGKRKLTIPSSMAYGTTGAGSTIPPNTALIFEVELRGVQ